MNPFVYDQVLFFTNRSNIDELILIMISTADDFLSKKIRNYLYAFCFSTDENTTNELNKLHEYLFYANDFFADKKSFLENGKPLIENHS